MIDFHTHILPEMDDGSSSLAQTMEMLRLLTFMRGKNFRSAF